MSSRILSTDLRLLLWALCIGLFSVCGTDDLLAQAQQPPVRMKVESIRVGFTGGLADGTGCFKAGLWTPVYVTLIPDSNSPMEFPVRADGQLDGTLLLSSSDCDDVKSTYVQGFVIDPSQRSTVVTYIKPSGLTVRVDLTLKAGGASYNVDDQYINEQSMAFGSQLYVTLGKQSSDLEKAAEEAKGRRVIGYETAVDQLPRNWFGYQAVDLLVLFTDNQGFLEVLTDSRKESSKARVRAVTEYVRRGGRVLIVVSRQGQENVRKLLESPYWHAPLGQYLSKDKTISMRVLGDFQTEIGARELAFPKQNPPTELPKLIPGLTAEVVPDNRLSGGPQLIRIPCGLGSVSLLNLDTTSPPFSNWDGTPKLWSYLFEELAPTMRVGNNQNVELKGMVQPYQNNPDADVASRLHRELEDFNVPIVSFGWVVLFIFLYILIVGPLDYFVLKNVFKRLEWTWITFPAVVLVISVLAYFTAYAMKGNDLRVNKVDLVEIDLRSSLNEDYTTNKMAVLGTSWFSVLSPRIQSYDIGLEPVPQDWGIKAPGKQPIGDVTMSWLGRPEGTGTAAFGRQRNQSLFKKDYLYTPDNTLDPAYPVVGPPAYGLKGVPIPVWTTKTFQASWDLPGLDPKQAPVQANLTYKADADQTLQGTLKNQLPVGLLEAYLIYQNNAYPLQSSLNAKGEGNDQIDVRTDLGTSIALTQWTDQNLNHGEVVQHTNGMVNTDAIIKTLLFHGKSQSNRSQNAVLGNLDQSWRIQRPNQLNKGVQTAIFIARLPRAEGNAEKLTTDNDPRLLTHLWLNALPGEQQSRPDLSGQMNQLTYLRIYIPVRPEQ